MRHGALPLLIMAASGCAAATVPPADETATEAAVPIPDDASVCDAARAKHLIGRQQSEEVGREALRLSGARALRWIRPGTVVTMDYRSDRLNIDLSGGGKITNIRCG